MEYIFLFFLGFASLYYIIKKLIGGLKGTDSPCAGCSEQECPFRDGEFEIEINLKE